ncbi:MAG: hypothetical protein L0Y35_07785 [Flammeovirgaceae bacterium]|nr:hypothetical protein [Flammeovirgaceae bacterium]
MNSITRQYLFGLLFITFGIYQLYIKDYLEFSLYTVAGLAFAVNGLTLEPRLAAYKKPLVIISWLLIIAAALLFLYLLQFKFT